MNRIQSLLVNSIMTCLLVATLSCDNKRSDDGASTSETPTQPDAPNAPAQASGNPYQELLNFAAGTYSGDCVSLNNGQTVPAAQVTLTDVGALNGGEFTAQFARETHVLSFDQKRDRAKANLISGEWNGHRHSVIKPTDSLLLRFASTAPDTRNNLAHARLEEEQGDKGWSCAVSNTNNMTQTDMYATFAKYLENPPTVFTACLCTADGDSGSPVPGTPADFSSTSATVAVQGNTMDLSQGFLEQMATHYPVDQSFTYSLKPADKELAVYVFDQDMKVKSFAAEFANGKKCTCQ